MKKRVFILVGIVIVFASCVSYGSSSTQSSGRGQSVEIRNWITRYEKEMYYGIGISSTGEENAVQQAQMLALQNLTLVLEEIIIRNYIPDTESQRLLDYERRNSIMQIVNQILRCHIRMYGPFVNGIGNIYIIAYLEKSRFYDEVRLAYYDPREILEFLRKLELLEENK